MKISSIQRNISLKQGGGNPKLLGDERVNAPGLFREKERSEQKYSAGVCEEGITNNFSGSFTGKPGAAVKLFDSKRFNSFLEFVDAKQVSAYALTALFFAGILRPFTLVTLSDKKNKENNIYASAHSVASGVLGFASSYAITTPLDKAVKAWQKSNPVAKAHQGALTTLVKNLPDWFISVPRAMLTIALIPPILKYVFGIEKKKKSAQPEIAQNNTADIIGKMSLQEFQGGAKS
ncbi:MAG: hypothetical protein LBJ74_05735 [Heliobacteriaceae bacterium]|jgi:hypothetical protein|nr:hypothetical protein [Heliobacteriaceae bacterium]